MTLFRPDCRHFRGDVPCGPHKLHGVHCADCTHYDPIRQRVLIIKLGALGDVVRTTPLLTPLRARFPQAEIHWLTLSPEILPASVDLKLPFDLASLLVIEETTYDYAINLDKDREACALMARVKAGEKHGFIWKDGRCAPVDERAVHKFSTGVFDDLSRSNTLSYLQEIFDIAGFTFQGEDYVLDNHAAGRRAWDIDRARHVVGLNTGCGGRWTSRLWSEDRWTELARHLKRDGYEVVLLGGPPEHDRNLRIAAASGATYFGHFDLQLFIDLLDQCDTVVTQVTMAMHLALGRHKNLVLMNNIFNRHEFELYGRGSVVEPSTGCECFYAPRCRRLDKGGHACMDDISAETVRSAVHACTLHRAPDA
ncbi:MAG TPA: glycosyltransferase family 9 protein [Flavobacteriales bacterium]|nr:glycosyltransferase family 9 protein [Flavobacteriales bacterium]HMR26075.1 glycosyltransferase family 9 protein [Flavobacteriales bacterium]